MGHLEIPISMKDFIIRVIMSFVHLSPTTPEEVARSTLSTMILHPLYNKRMVRVADDLYWLFAFYFTISIPQRRLQTIFIWRFRWKSVLDKRVSQKVVTLLEWIWPQRPPLHLVRLFRALQHLARPAGSPLCPKRTPIGVHL